MSGSVTQESAAAFAQSLLGHYEHGSVGVDGDTPIN